MAAVSTEAEDGGWLFCGCAQWQPAGGAATYAAEDPADAEWKQFTGLVMTLIDQSAAHSGSGGGSAPAAPASGDEAWATRSKAGRKKNIRPNSAPILAT